MRSHLIGVDVEDLRLPVKDALHKAAELEFHAVELPTVTGDVTPRNLSASGRRHLARYVENLGLDLSALAADIPALRLTDPRTVDERVARTCEIIDLAKDLGTPIVTASVGALTHPETGGGSRLAVEALHRIGEYADARGVVYAIRPSGDAGDRLARVLDELRCPSIRIGLDPAAMVMSGVNPLSAVERLPDRIALLHARDATAGLSDRPGRETQLGEGDVDFVGLLSLLEAAQYRGPYIVRRYDSPHPIADLQAARDTIARALQTP
ncbi:MAG: sugar phosphate isomerase/epimerase family protein [Planctomycetota bacterium]